jgi:Fe2+ transport system protein B
MRRTVKSLCHNLIIHPIAGIGWFLGDMLTLFVSTSHVGQAVISACDRMHEW